MKKRILSYFLTITMLLSVVGIVPVMAENIVTGTIGENLTWVIDDAGTLTISGTGQMAAFDWSWDYPWNEYSDSVTRVVIEEGVTTVANDAFSGFSALTEVELPTSLKAIYSYAFCNCNFSEITISPNVEIVEMMAFYGVETIYGYTYSAAEAYANMEEVNFVSLGELPESVLSQDSCGEGVTYTLTNRGVITVSGSGEIDSYEYMESPWSEYMMQIKSVVINEGITAIGDGAFNGCGNVASVTIPEGVTSIGNMAFYGCYIETLKLPSTLLTIGDNAFDSSGLTELVIPEGVISIGTEAFAYAPLTIVTIPESVTYIGDGAFGDGYDIPSIKGIKGSYAETWANENYASFLPIYKEPVTGTWGDNLSWVFNPDGTLTITGEGAMAEADTADYYPWYEYSRSITNIVIGDGVTSVSWYAFQYCSNLISVTLSYKVERVGYSAFYFAPDNLVVKGYKNSYAENFALTYSYTFKSLGDAPEFEVANGYFDGNVAWSCNNYGLVTVSGTGKCDYSSNWHSYLTVTEMVIEEGITSIGDWMFADMSRLKKVTLPRSLQSIGSYAFRNCPLLTEIAIPAGVTAIGSCAFDSSVTIKGYSPSEAEDFAESNGNTFESVGKTPLTVVASGECGDNLTWTVDNYRVLTISGTGAMSYEKKGTIGGDVGVGGVELMSVSYYDVPWYDYTTYVKEISIEEGVTTIADYAFYGFENVTEIILPESVVSIGNYAFNNCEKLEKVQIYYNATDIADNIFYYTYNVTVYGYTYSVAEECATEIGISFISLGEAPILEVASGNVSDTIVWSLNSRGTLAISGTGEMPHYTYNGPRPWDEYSARIKSVEITGVDRVYEYTISNCDNLTSVKLTGVKCVDSQAFNYCSYITEAIISPETEKLGRTAFYYNASNMTIKGAENSYAQIYAEAVGSTFEELGDVIEVETVYVSTVEGLLSSIGSNKTIVLKDGIYLLDKTGILGDVEYSWRYADIIRIENVSNLTIKAENPGKAEIISSQISDLGYDSYQNAVFLIKNAYNLTFDGLRIGNMQMHTNNGSEPKGDDAELMGGYDEYALGDYYAFYITDSDSGEYVMPANNVNFVNCDVFNCAYAYYISSGSLNIENCTIRDNIQGAIRAMSSEVAVTNTTFSRNGSSSAYKGTYCFDMTTGSVKNSVFINNGNEIFAPAAVEQTDNIFENNVWDGKSMKAYGITQNGITWQVANENDSVILRIGYAINAENTIFESKLGTIYPYSVNSLPWREYEIDSVTLNEGVAYNELIWGACGRNCTWTFNPSTKTLAISGSGEMSDIDTEYMWGKYSSDIENIVIADTVTGVYNCFDYTAYSINESNWENGLLYIGDVLVKADIELEGEVRLKDGTRVVADEAFYNCQKVTGVVFPESVEHIGVTEKLNVGEMGYNGVFEYCYALEKLTIPANVTAFDHAMVYHCEGLKDIYYSGTTAQWEAVSVGKRNEQLGYATIHTTDGTIMPDLFYYEVSEDGVTITGVYPFAEEIVIPAQIDGLPVVEIAYDAFMEHKTVKRVTIDAAIEEAPYFANAKELESIEFGESIKYVFYGAFDNCEKLNKITLRGELEELSSGAFIDTAYYKNPDNWDGGILYVDGYAAALSEDAEGTVTVRSDARGVGYDMFSKNDTVTEVVIPDGVKVKFTGEAFYNMKSLEKLTLPETFVPGEYGFGVYDCEKLENITISENHPTLTSLDGVVLSKDMTELVYMPMGKSGSYEIPECVTTIRSRAFDNTHLSELTIPESVRTIADEAFPHSYYLSDIYYDITTEEWENSIYVGYQNDAFNAASLHLSDNDFEAELLYYYISDNGTYYTLSGCASYLTEVKIPAMHEGLPVKAVDSYAFFNARNLSEINVDANNGYFASIDGVLFTKDKSKLLAYPAGKDAESYTLPENVTAIGEEAFANSRNLKSIDLGDSLTYIGMRAFENSGITSVRVPESVTELGRGVFNTDSLEKVYFGTHITSITDLTFSHALKYIYFDGTLYDWQDVTGWWYVDAETQVITKVEILEEQTHARREEDVISVNFRIEGADWNQTVLAIGLDAEGCQVTNDEVTGEYVYAGWLEIEGDDETLDKVKEVKLFVWESIESMRPLCEPVIVKVEG